MAKRHNLSSVKDEVVAELNVGRRETRNLMESLRIDFAELLHNVCPGAEVSRMKRACQQRVGILERTRLGGELIQQCGKKVYEPLARHPSDTVRSWACFAMAGRPGLTLGERLEVVKPYAADRHFGVREWAWMVVRPYLALELDRAIEHLEDWVRDSDPYLRRFGTEVTRPRGVWCAHIRRLVEDPELGEPLLEPLRADPEKYVQDSVANWLNDASKSQPEFVWKITERWLKVSDTPATRRIVSRALRTIGPMPAGRTGKTGALKVTRKPVKARVKH